MPCGWAGNCRSAVALGMCHRLQWFTLHRRGHGLTKGYEDPTYTPRGVWHSLTFYGFDSTVHGQTDPPGDSARPIADIGTKR